MTNSIAKLVETNPNNTTKLVAKISSILGVALDQKPHYLVSIIFKNPRCCASIIQLAQLMFNQEISRRANPFGR